MKSHCLKCFGYFQLLTISFKVGFFLKIMNITLGSVLVCRDQYFGTLKKAGYCLSVKKLRNLRMAPVHVAQIFKVKWSLAYGCF